MSIHTHSNHFLASKYSQRQKSITSNKYKSVIFLTKRIAGLSSISKIQKVNRYDAIQPDKQLIQTARNKQKVIQEQIQSIQKEMGCISHQDKIKALMKPVYRGKNSKINNKVLDVLRVKSQMQTQRKFPVQNTYTSRDKNNRNTITHTDTNKRKPTYQYSCHRKKFVQSGHNNLSLIGNKKKIQDSKSQLSDQKLLISQKKLIIPNDISIQSQKQDESKLRLRITNDDYICKSNRVDHHKSQITYQNEFKKSQRRYDHLKQLEQFLDIDIDIKDGPQDYKDKNADFNQLQYQEYLNDNMIPQKLAKIRKKKKRINQKDKEYLIPRNGLYMSMYMRMHNHTQHEEISYQIKSNGMNEVELANKAHQQQLKKSKRKSKKYLIKNYSFSQIHSMCKLGSPKTNKSNDFYKSYDKNKISKHENANQQQNKIHDAIVSNNFVNISGKSYQKSNKRNQKNSTVKSKTYFNNLKYRYSKNNGNLALDMHGPTIVIDPW